MAMNDNDRAERLTTLIGSRLQGVLIFAELAWWLDDFSDRYVAAAKQAHDYMRRSIPHAGGICVSLYAGVQFRHGVQTFVCPSMTTDNTFLLNSKGKLTRYGMQLGGRLTLDYNWS